MKKLTNEQVINRLKDARGADNFDYSSVNYINRRTPITIFCKIHNKTFQTYIESFIKGNTKGCEFCGKESYKNKRSFAQEEIIEQFKKVHKDEYDYSKMKYINIDTPVEIICKLHGSFFQSPYEHKNGAKCPKCFGRNKVTEDVIKLAKLIHGDKYDYSLINYKNANEKMDIICKKHGIFKQNFKNHITLKCGCPICNSSKGENKISLILKENNILNIPQYSFSDCKDLKPLPFDFYLQKQNILIEYDGIEHFQPIEFGGDPIKNFNLTKKHDKIKTEYCKKNKIKLIRISYLDSIEEIINKEVICLEKK